MARSAVTIQGIREAQRANQRAIAGLKPNGPFGKAIKEATVKAHRYAVSITHVDTGALRASHRMKVTGIRGEIFIDRGTRNPKTGERPAAYGAEEHARGGQHAFYERTVKEAGDGIARETGETILKGVAE